MLPTNSEDLLEYLGRHIDYKDKVLIIPKNKNAERFIKEKYPTIKKLSEVIDYFDYKRENKIYVITDIEKRKKVYENFPSELFKIIRDEHLEFI